MLCSAVAFSLQLWGQRYVEPSRAAVILLFEQVVAGVVGYAVGERLGVAGLRRRGRDPRRDAPGGIGVVAAVGAVRSDRPAKLLEMTVSL